MKKILLILIIIISALSLRAQRLVIDSTRFITGSNHSTGIQCVMPTGDNGILFVGYIYGNPDGIIPYFPNDTVLSNVLIGKLDSNRIVSWIKIYGGSQDDYAIGACQTPDGGYAVMAGTGSDDGDVTGYKGNGDIWLLRIDPSGNLLWEKTFGSSSQDGPLSIANTPDHGFILLGVTYGSDGDVPFHYGDMWSDDWLVVKTDSMGNKQWSKDLGGTANEYPAGSILAVDNNYYLLSGTSSEDHDCIDTSWHSTGISDDYYVLKLDTAGNVLWDSSYGGGGSEDVINALFDPRDSTLVMTGTTTSNDYMVTGYHSCLDMGDIWVVKINKDGKLLWEKTLGSIQEETGTGICASLNGGYLAYGSTLPYYCHDSTLADIGGQDCWVFNLDSAGNTIDNKIFGGTDVELPRIIIPYLNGYVATGISASTVFTEGTNYGRNSIGECGFISYIDQSGLSVNNLNTSKYNLKAYPNPAQTDITISIPGTGKLAIINSIGQVIYKMEVNSNTTLKEVSFSEWRVGVYLIIWQGEDGELLTTKLIKN